MTFTKKAARTATHVNDRTKKELKAKKLHRAANRFGIGYTERQLKILNDEIPLNLVRLLEIRSLIDRAHYFGDSETELNARGLCVRKIQELEPTVELDEKIFTKSDNWVDQMTEDILAGKDVNFDFLMELDEHDDRDESNLTTKVPDASSGLRKSGEKQPVIQYSLEGNFIAYYPSIKEAAQKLGGYPGNLGRSCSMHKQYKGFQWRKWSELSNTPFPEKIDAYESNICRKVYQYDEYNCIVNVYYTLSEAARSLNVSNNALRRMINNRYFFANSFWSYDPNDDFHDCERKNVKPKTIIVHQFDNNGTYIKSYKSIAEATAETGLAFNLLRHLIDTGLPSKVGYFSFTLDNNHFQEPVKKTQRKPVYGRPVYKFSPDGKLLASFKNSTEASKDAKCTTTYLCNSLRLHSLYNGAYWSYEKVWTYKTANERRPSKRPVCCLDENGTVVKTYPSLRDAAHCVTTGPDGLKKIIASGQFYEGYYWKFKSDIE